MRVRDAILMVLLLPSMAAAAERVAVFFDVPAGLQGYSGVQPVTFGVPIERRTLRRSHGLRVVDSAGRALPAQFEVTATWAPNSDEVRWLLVDLLVELRNSQAPKAFLEFGPDFLKPITETGLEARVPTAGRSSTAAGERSSSVANQACSVNSY